MGSPIEDAMFEALRRWAPERSRAIEREREVLTYRLDFAIDTASWTIDIECDGHDFHDRTKQQAAYDRSRDRELLRHGVIVIRFTGSEIHHDADRCAHEVYACIEAVCGRPVPAIGDSPMAEPEFPPDREVAVITLLADHPSLIASVEAEDARAAMRDRRIRLMYDRARAGESLIELAAHLPAGSARLALSHKFANVLNPRAMLMAFARMLEAV